MINLRKRSRISEYILDKPNPKIDIPILKFEKYNLFLTDKQMGKIIDNMQFVPKNKKNNSKNVEDLSEKENNKWEIKSMKKLVK